MLEFRLVKGGRAQARAGILKTNHGEIATPCFMPVGTAATVKGMAPWDLKEIGAKMILANTYHLLLRPGIDVISRLGGLHKFMGWHGPILTDSGGYQVVSLGENVKLSDDGVVFASHIDGSKIELTPEGAVRAQSALGVDIAMALDEPVKLPSTREKIEAASKRTSAWAKRCLDERNRINSASALFGIVQGGDDEEIRRSSAKEISSLGFDGFAIGGLSVGEDNEILHKTAKFTAPLLPEDKPRYLMGVGNPADLLRAIGNGIDLFDCVLPTRNARTGWIYTFNGTLRIKHSAYKEDIRPPDEGCRCATCINFSRAYLRHLYMSGEMLAGMLITRHNLHFYMQLIESAEKAIAEGRYEEYAAPLLEKLKINGCESEEER